MCGCTKISRNMARKKISFKKAQDNIPYAIGGAAGLVAQSFIDPMLGSNAYVAAGAKAVAGLILTGFGGKMAVGAGVVLASYGIGQLVNTVSGGAVPGLPGASGDAVSGIGFSPAYKSAPFNGIAGAGDFQVSI